MKKENLDIHSIIKDNIQIAVQEALEKHQKLGNSVVIAKNGKPIHLSPEKILFEMNERES